ncbi:multidrug efflux MFS transporter, partial [Amycolatopsis rhizosphaerae]
MTTAVTADRTRWGAVVAVALGSVLAGLDLTVVAVALPGIGTDLGVSPASAQWVMLGYLLPMVALSIPAGRWLDLAAPRAAFLLATAGFGMSSVLIALAPDFALVLAGRALQGVFGSLLGALAMPVIGETVRPEHRARAMSIVLTLLPLSSAAGPALGGLLTEAFGWRSVFLINIPLAVAAAWAGLRSIPRRSQGLPPP